MEFTYSQWLWMISAINGIETSAYHLVDNLYAHSDYDPMPEGLAEKLDRLKPEECDRLHQLLLEFWRKPHINDNEQRLREIGAILN